MRHLAHSAGWKKFEGLWNGLIRLKQVSHALPILERVLLGNESPPPTHPPLARNQRHS